jgi:multiple antibiotic resistance protein
VFLIGIELLRGEATKTREPVNELEQDDQAYLGLAVTPLATPILAGPGTIVTAVNFIAEGSVVQDAVTLGIFAVMCLWTYWMFVSGQRIVNFLGRNAVTVIGRLMGLILATLGVHMLSLGIYGSVVEGMRFIAEQP